MTAFLAGFRKSTLTGVQINVSGKTRLNLVLQVGSVQQSLVVEGHAGLLQSDTSAVSQVIDNRTMTCHWVATESGPPRQDGWLG